LKFPVWLLKNRKKLAFSNVFFKFVVLRVKKKSEKKMIDDAEYMRKKQLLPSLEATTGIRMRTRQNSNHRNDVQQQQQNSNGSVLPGNGARLAVDDDTILPNKKSKNKKNKKSNDDDYSSLSSSSSSSYLSSSGSSESDTSGALGGNSLYRRSARSGPLYKLTVGLIRTYRKVNEVYYERQQAKRAERQVRCDDDAGNYIVRKGEVLKGRYELGDFLGNGSFGQVISALDKQTNERVAVKIIKNSRPFFKQAQIEVRILEMLRERDEHDEHFMVRILDKFIHREHLCIVCEVLSLSLFDVLRTTRFQGVSLSLVRKFGEQILAGLNFLHHIDIIHCDLKVCKKEHREKTSDRVD
jgi:Protein kinase domain